LRVLTRKGNMKMVRENNPLKKGEKTEKSKWLSTYSTAKKRRQNKRKEFTRTEQFQKTGRLSKREKREEKRKGDKGAKKRFKGERTADAIEGQVQTEKTEKRHGQTGNIVLKV